MREILWIVYLWLSFFIVKVCLVFFWVWFYCVSLSSVSRQNIQLDIFQKVPCLSTSFIFYSLILIFFGGVFLGCVLIWTSFASPHFLRTSSWTFWISSGAPRWDVRAVSFAWKHHFWGHIAFLEALCTLYVHIVALHYTQRCWLLSPAADRLTNAHKIRWVLLAACVALWTSQRIKKS